MITNPNTCGLFEPDMIAICDAVHAAGGFVYCDGANFNAIVGRVRPGDLGIDAMHINLHKTFSTPHGGGGPGSGPVVFSAALAPFAPLPFVRRVRDKYELVEEAQALASADHDLSFGRMVAFHGQMGMFVRALSYILSHGADGLRQVAEDAVLNANYVLRSLEDIFTAPFAATGPCMHEALFSDDFLSATGLTTLDLAKALIDEGFHPMTMYFPLVVHGAMLVEPTETESKASLDQLIGALRSVATRMLSEPAETFKQSPHLAPRRRLDETAAARKPVLTWREPAGVAGGGVSGPEAARRFFTAPRSWRTAVPTSPKPTIMSAQLPGSGVAAALIWNARASPLCRRAVAQPPSPLGPCPTKLVDIGGLSRYGRYDCDGVNDPASPRETHR